MSALDKLNAKAKEHTEKKNQLNNDTSEKNDNKSIGKHIEKEKKQIEIEDALSQKITKKVVQEKKVKHAGGRPKTRGKYKMVNVAVPEDVYNRLKEVCNGNMTYYLNDIIRKNVNM